jgi:histidyl-tRNA synthetase
MAENNTQPNTKLSTQPYKGARDFYPNDMRLENYIFDTWRSVCKKYGFEEYSFPILEPFEIFAAKTGEEIVNQQLFSFEDRGGRKLAIRPELTPGTVRMIAQRFNEIPQPIKWFMIGNNWRYERPQLGRGREFYQLEVNTFGVESVTADFEIISLIVAIMKAFGATEQMFEININDRRLISALLNEVLALGDRSEKVRRLMDKRAKMTKDEFLDALKDLAVTGAAADKIEAFMSGDLASLKTIIPEQVLNSNKGYSAICKLFKLLKDAGLDKYVKFDPAIIRGFDYSDGLVYEVFDKNPANRRSLFGGERFDKLINIFGNYNLPATGFALGDYTLKEFITGWKLIPYSLEESEDFLVTLWADDPNMQFFNKSQELADKLRALGKTVTVWLEPNTKLDKQLKYADKKNINYALIIGDTELSEGKVTIKNLKDQTQQTVLEKDLEMLSY